MPVFELYSYRKRVAEGATPDILIYDELPELGTCPDHSHMEECYRTKCIYIEFFGDVKENNADWHEIHEIVAQEHGLFRLSNDDQPIRLLPKLSSWSFSRGCSRYH